MTDRRNPGGRMGGPGASVESVLRRDTAEVAPSPNGVNPKLTVVVEAFTPRVSNTLRGFVSILVPELHLKVHDITVHEKGEARWAGLPSKPQVTRDGLVRKDESGRTLYSPVLEFADRATRDAFSRRVIAALLEFAPAAFEEEAV